MNNIIDDFPKAIKSLWSKSTLNPTKYSAYSEIHHTVELKYVANSMLHYLHQKLTKYSFKNISSTVNVCTQKRLSQGFDTADFRGSRCAELCFRANLSSDHHLDIQYQVCRFMSLMGFLCFLSKKRLMQTEDQQRKHVSLQLCQVCQQQSFLFTGP